MSAPARGLFVTGTDTGVGKTLVSCAVLRALRRRGRLVGVYKPVETGCPSDAEGRRYGEDCRRLLAAADTGQPESSVASALYPIPAAPLVSAEAEHASIDPDLLVRDFEKLAADYDSVLVEGAGGLLVPIAPAFTYADLAERLGLPVLVVVGSRLGCLNHALLTLAELERRGLRVAGYVLNALEGGESRPDAPHALATHRDTLSRFCAAADLGQMPFVAPAARDDFDALAAAAESQLELARLPL
ncbi:MAG: dethiobiotin synthase [Myxococcota bacterium]|nr:dethiobiotin synthase [Myxococcota bacterium]